MQPEPTPTLTIVALGASAGGLEALQGFFAAMPADPRFAFVVITRTWTTGWLLAFAGSATLTAVDLPARLGPSVASLTNPVGRLVYAPLEPTRNCVATGWAALSIEPSRSRAV